MINTKIFKQSKLKFVIILIVTVAIMWYLLTKVSLSDFKEAVSQYNIWILVLGFLIYIVLNIWRALRFRALLKNQIGFKKMLHIVFIHNFFNNLIPMRAGELSFVYLVRTQKLKATKGLSTLIIGRVFDFIMISIIFLLSMLLVKNIPVEVYNVLWIVALFFFIILAFLLLLVFKGMIFVNALRKIFKTCRIDKNKIFRFILKKSEETILGIKVLRSARLLAHTFLLSICIWITYYGFVYLIINELGMGLSFWAICLGLTFALLTTVLPIHGVAGFGSLEGVWTLVFVALGVATSLAVLSGFVYHIINIIYLLILGIPALLLWRK